MKTVYNCFFHLSRIKIGIAQLLFNCKQKTIQEIALERLRNIANQLISMPYLTLNIIVYLFSLLAANYLLGWMGLALSKVSTISTK